MNNKMNSESYFYHSSQLKDTWSHFNQKEANKRSLVLQIYLLLLYHLSPLHKTMPLWFDKSVWKLFLGSDCESDERDLS
jgi:hypothetical protein